MQARDIVDGLWKTVMEDGQPAIDKCLPKAPKNPTVAHVIARVWVGQAALGDKDARKELHDRLYGKVPDEIIPHETKRMTDREAVDSVKALDEERDRLLGLIKDTQDDS
jgi:hypothetical protein